MAGLDKFIEENEGVTATSKGGEEAQKTSAAGDEGGLDGLPPVKDDGTPAPKKDEEKKVVESTQDDDEPIGLPELGAEGLGEQKVEKKDAAFDEAAFDAQTAKEVEGLDPKQGEAWKELKGQLKAYKMGEITADTAKARIAELEAKNAELEEIAGTVKAMEEKSAGLIQSHAELVLKESDEYQSTVAKPYADIKKTVAAISEAKSIEEGEIWKILQEAEPAKRMAMLDELEKTLPARYTLAVENMANDMQAIMANDARMRKDAVAIVEAQKAKAAGEAPAELEARKNATMDATRQSFSRFAEKIPGFTDSVGALTEDAKGALAKALLTNPNEFSPGDHGYMIFSVQALPHALKTIRNLEKENRQLRVAAGDKGRDIVSGSTPKDHKTVDDHINKETGQPRTFMEGLMAQNFAQ